jgi:hypothetical protein
MTFRRTSTSSSRCKRRSNGGRATDDWGWRKNDKPSPLSPSPVARRPSPFARRPSPFALRLSADAGAFHLELPA